MACRAGARKDVQTARPAATSGNARIVTKVVHVFSPPGTYIKIKKPIYKSTAIRLKSQAFSQAHPRAAMEKCLYDKTPMGRKYAHQISSATTPPMPISPVSLGGNTPRTGIKKQPKKKTP